MNELVNTLDRLSRESRARRTKIIVARLRGSEPSFNQRAMIQFFEAAGYQIVYRDLDARPLSGSNVSQLIIDEIVP